ncbi:Immunity-related GTPase family M protein [Sciurus carolinensis]|uniref:Immunity-related GTPase family M protein n=1 Tax=Sciurus carolinensis TaxID=30640 RepID=A0AA41MTJ2_SCICA|nr:Immunity-related GTPase family M protein [Sciurus carolinensis]
MAKAPVSHYTPLSTSFTSVVSYNKGWNILIFEELSRNIEKALKEGKLLEVVSVVRETMERASRTQVSIAVTGESGNGMSSFINALRFLGHEEEASAPIGVVRTTQTRGSYTSSHFPNVVLWDLPGMGTTAQGLENYLKEMQFSHYDLFIIIASEQFSINHVKLARAIQRMGKRFYVVWTKLDRDLSTSALSKGQLLQNIQKNIKENFQKERVCEPPMFLVSNFDPLLHDFPKLRNTLQIDLLGIRCRGPLDTLSHICEETINDKVNSLKGRLSTEYLEDILGIRNADDLGECLEAYKLLFGVDNASLQQVAQSMGTWASEYMTIMKSQDLHTLCGSDWKMKLMTCLIMRALLKLFRYIPFLGNLVIHCFRYMRHRRILELVAQDTKNILMKILKNVCSPPDNNFGNDPASLFFGGS